jgi:hypothetical protein
MGGSGSTPSLAFAVEGAEAVPYAVTPQLGLRLRITNDGVVPVHAVALDCQVRIDAQRRRYTPSEKERLVELFGEPSRWSGTLRSLLWTHASVSVPPFESEIAVDLLVPCTADFTALAGKYYAGLDQPDESESNPPRPVPITLLFSGSVFYTAPTGALQVTRIPWTAEATYDVPVAAWRGLVDHYYPNTAWLTVRRDVFEELCAYKLRRALPTWEGVLEELLKAADEAAERGVR